MLQEKPTAKIAVKKNLVKVYNVNNVNTVYLKNETQFQIELFNPLQIKVLCEIFINDLISGKLVLYPGQRIFLERYLSDNKKFKFVTYDVDNTDVVKNAIKNNGKIKINFYEESLLKNVEFFQPDYYVSKYTTLPNVFYCSDNTSVNLSNTTSTTNSFKNKSISTGIISKGDTSDQKFTSCDYDFLEFPTSTEIIKILPYSEKIYDDKDIKSVRNYCSECGSKLKYKDKYCSQCGTKIN